MLVSLILSTFAIALPQTTVGVFQAPQPGDVRSPCPGLNVLSNHGFLPRNGKGITPEMATNTFLEIYNVGTDISKFLLDQTFMLGLNDTESTFTLESIAVHSNPQRFIEHDASLVHIDFALAGNTTTIDQNLVEKLVSYASNGKTMTFTEFAAYRKDRTAEAKATNPQIDFGERPQVLAFAETSLIFNVFKNQNDEIPVESLRAFLGQEKLPEGFVKRSDVLGLGPFRATSAQMRALQ